MTKDASKVVTMVGIGLYGIDRIIITQVAMNNTGVSPLVMGISFAAASIGLGILAAMIAQWMWK